MKRIQRAASILLGLAGIASAASFSGTVTDRAQRGVAGVEIRNATTGTLTRTDAQGKWTLTPPTGVVRDGGSRIMSRWDGHALLIECDRATVATIEAFGSDGGVLVRLEDLALQAGASRVPLELPRSGIAWIGISRDGRREVLMAGAGLRTLATTATHVTARSLAAPDTLTFTWSSRTVVRIPVTAGKDTSGILVRFDTSTAVPWKTGVAYGFLHDVRDGQVYRTITLGLQTWMAENLNRIVDSSWWYKGLDASRPAGDSIDENVSKGTRYGRYYKWAAAMALHDSCNSKSCSHLAPGDHPGICPQGWHVPSASEMATLVANAEKDTRVRIGNGGRALKSTTGWKSNNGWDYFGFRALPNGYRPSNGKFMNAGYDGYWITSTQADGSVNPASTYFMSGYTWGSMESFEFGSVQKSYAHPLRCKRNTQ